MILNVASYQVLLFTRPISFIPPLPSNLMLQLFELFTSEDNDDIIILHKLVSLLGRPFYTVCSVNINLAFKISWSVPEKAKDFFLSSFLSQIVYVLLCPPAVDRPRNICIYYYNSYLFICSFKINEMHNIKDF